MKKIFLAVALLFLLCGGARAQTITLVQSNHSTGTTAVTNKAVAYASNPTTGNLLIACDNWGNNVGTHSVSDTLTNTWTEFLSNARGITGLNDLTCFWAKTASTGADTVTVSVSGGGSHTLRVAIFEYSSSTGWPATPVDQHNAASNATASCCTTGNPGNITPSSSGTLIFSAMQTGNAGLSGITLSGCTEQPAGGTGGTGWLSDARADSADVEGATTSSQTCAYSWTGSSAWSAVIQNFTPNAGGGGGGTAPPLLPLTGVGAFTLTSTLLAQPVEYEVTEASAASDRASPARTSASPSPVDRFPSPPCPPCGTVITSRPFSILACTDIFHSSLL